MLFLKGRTKFLLAVAIVLASALPLILSQPQVQAAPSDSAGLDSQSVYPTINPGDSVYIFVRVVNVGSTTWRANGRDGYGFFGLDGWATYGRADLWRDVGPGSTITFGDTVTPPTRPGVYRYGFLITRYGQSIGPYFFIDITVRDAGAGSSRRSLRQNPYCPGSFCDQCTAFAEEMMHEATNLWMTVTGHAFQWPDQARVGGWTVGSSPETSSVIVMPYDNGRQYWYMDADGGWRQTAISSYGHVGWVDAISCSGLCVHLRDRNWNLDGRDGERWLWIGSWEPVSFIYSSY